MADGSLTLNAGTGGEVLDVEDLVGGTVRERHQVAGALLAQVAQVLNTDITSGYGLATRAILPAAPATGTLSNVNNATSSGTALGSNTARKQATFYNDDTAASVFLKLNSGAASATSFTVKLPPGGLYELPRGSTGVYTGAITCIATAATGTLRVTEIT